LARRTLPEKRYCTPPRALARGPPSFAAPQLRSRASAAALAGEPKPATPQEPIGFVTGGVIGAFAAGPVGAVVGAGIGTWLGNRVHRAKDATQAEATAAALQAELGEIVRKNDYRFRGEPWGSEKDAWLRALQKLKRPRT